MRVGGVYITWWGSEDIFVDLVLEIKVRLSGLVVGALTLINIGLFRHLIYN